MPARASWRTAGLPITLMYTRALRRSEAVCTWVTETTARRRGSLIRAAIRAEISSRSSPLTRSMRRRSAIFTLPGFRL